MTVMNRPSLDFHQDSRIDLAAVLRMLFDPSLGQMHPTTAASHHPVCGCCER